MTDTRAIAGVILAGGRSSRMGQNKALLDYHGKPLIAHMADILKKTGIGRIVISGQIDGCDNNDDATGNSYECLPDPQPFTGPAEAIKSIIKQLPDYAGLLFIPVDMPLLKPEMLHVLLQQKDGAYFIDWPLPAFITPPYPHSNSLSVHGILADYGIYPVALPDHFAPFMKNANTQQDWNEVIAS